MTIAIPPVPSSPLVRPRRQPPPPVPAEPTAPPAAETPTPWPADVAANDQGETVAAPVADEMDEDELTRRAHELRAAVFSRLNRDGRWTRLQLGDIRDDMMRECTRGRRMAKHEAQIWTYSEIDRLYPPSLTTNTDAGRPGVNHLDDGDTPADAGEPSNSFAREADSIANGNNGTERVPVCQPSIPESARLQGLGDVPVAWPSLPANASLQAEIGWVQANRLAVVEERGQATLVRLERAHEPAPSRAAIGWLETSIRSYAKFVDVAARCLTTASDEVEQVRRERMAIAELRALLAEMHADPPETEPAPAGGRVTPI